MVHHQNPAANFERANESNHQASNFCKNQRAANSRISSRKILGDFGMFLRVAGEEFVK